MGCEQTAHAATKLSKSGQLSVDQVEYIKNAVDQMEISMTALPAPLGTDAPPPQCELDDGGFREHDHADFPHFDLLLREEVKVLVKIMSSCVVYRALTT